MQSKFRQTDLAFRNLFALCVLFILGLSAGCRVVGPDHAGTPPPALGATYRGQITDEELTLMAQQELSHWWVHLNDPVLMQLIQVAAHQNLDLQDATLRIMQARAEVGIVTGQLGPEVDATLDVLTVKRSANGRATGATSVNSNPFGLFSIGVATNWELDLFGRIARSVEAARSIYGAQVENLRDVQTTLLSDIAVAYARIRLAQELMEIQQQNLALREKHLEDVKVRFEAGDVGLLDVTQAEAILYSTRAQLPLLKQEVDINLNRIAVLVGEVPTQALESVIGMDRIPSPNQRIAVGVPADLLRRRPDIRFAEKQVAETSARIGIAESELYPRLSLLGTISFDSRNLSDLIDIDSLTFGLGPQFRWNILQWGRITCNIEAAKLAHKNAIINYQRTVLLGVEEVENGLARFNTTVQADRDFRKGIQLAKKSLELADEQYNAGRVDFNRLIEAQRRLLDAQVVDANNRAAQLLAIIQTYKAAGGGWEAFEEAKQGGGFTVTMEKQPTDDELADEEYSSEYYDGDRELPDPSDGDDMTPERPTPEADDIPDPDLDAQSRYEAAYPSTGETEILDANFDRSAGTRVENYVDELPSDIPRPPSDTINAPQGESLPNPNIELDPSKIDPSKFDKSIKSIDVPGSDDFSGDYPKTSTPEFDLRSASRILGPTDTDLSQPFASPGTHDSALLNRLPEEQLVFGDLDYEKHPNFHIARMPRVTDVDSMVAGRPNALLIVNASVKPKQTTVEKAAPSASKVTSVSKSGRKRTSVRPRVARLPSTRKAKTSANSTKKRLASKRPRTKRSSMTSDKIVTRFPMRGPFMENSDVADRVNRSQKLAARSKSKDPVKPTVKRDVEMVARNATKAHEPKKKVGTATVAVKKPNKSSNHSELRIASAEALTLGKQNPLRRSVKRLPKFTHEQTAARDLKQPKKDWQIEQSPSRVAKIDGSDDDLVRLPNVRFRSLPSIEQETVATSNSLRQPNISQPRSSQAITSRPVSSPPRQRGDVLADIDFKRLQQTESSPSTVAADGSPNLPNLTLPGVSSEAAPELPERKVVAAEKSSGAGPVEETKITNRFGAVVRIAKESVVPGRKVDRLSEDTEEIRVGNTQIFNGFTR